MDRRSFLSAIGTFTATAALDPERLLWRPTKKIFIPAAPSIELVRSFDIRARAFGAYFINRDGLYELRCDDPFPMKISKSWIEILPKLITEEILERPAKTSAFSPTRLTKRIS